MGAPKEVDKENALFAYYVQCASEGSTPDPTRGKEISGYALYTVKDKFRAWDTKREGYDLIELEGKIGWMPRKRGRPEAM